MIYHKISNVFQRDPITNKLIIGYFLKREFRELANIQWIATEKIDGTNIRIMWDGNELSFGGKTDNAEFPPGFLNVLEKTFKDSRQYFFEKFGDKKVVIYGEGYGGNIHRKKGQFYGMDQALIIFDIWVNGVWLNRGSMVSICGDLKLSCIPHVCTDTLTNIISKVKNKEVTSFFGDFLAEGVVARPVIELSNNKGERIITKIKYKDF